MNRDQLDSLCARINSVLDVREYIYFLDYYPERAIKVQGVWRMLCPVHGEQMFRTLVLNPRRNTAHCEHSACTAHKPMNLISLAVLVRGEAPERVVVAMVDFFGQAKLELDEDQRALVEQLRAACAE